MLHGMINEQGNCLDVRDDILEKILTLTCVSINLQPLVP